MCNWKKWFWPGLVTTAFLTALTGWFLSGPVENDLALRAGDSLKAGQPWATIAFDGRDATVTGIAENDIQQREAASITLSTNGVRVVANTAGLPEKVDPFTLSMVKDAAGVTLKGNYASSQDRAALVAAAETAMPGIAVKDELTLAAGKPEGFDALAGFGVSQLADLTGGEVSLSNLDYAIKGDPVDVPSYEKLNAATSGALPGAGVLKSADLSIPVLGKPYQFAGRFEGDAINLEGYAPSMDVKNAIESKAKEIFPGKSVNNLLKLAGGAPEGFSNLVNFGLGQLKTMGNGSFSLSDMNYSLKGAPTDAAAFEAITKAARESLPSGAVLAAAELVAPAVPEPVTAPEPAPAPAPEPAMPFIWSAVSAPEGVLVQGDVASADAAKAAIELATRRFLNSEVKDAQTIREGAPEGFAEAQSNLLKSLSYLTSGKAALSDVNATLEGIAPSQPLADLAVAKAKAALPQNYQLTARIKVEEPTAPAAPAIITEPYIWSALSDASGVTLEGSVLSSDVSKMLSETATAALPGKAITNRLAPRNPSPAGFATAQSALLSALGGLKEGSASLSDLNATLKGIAESDAAKAAAEAAAKSGLPQGYQLATEITVAAPAPAPTPNTCLQDVATLLSEGQINFRRAKADIDPSSYPLLDKIGVALGTCAEAKVEIGGHTDSDGEDAYNQVLSEQRANAVRRYLSNGNASGARLSAKGYGESQPLDSNDTPENKAKNRRIEFRSVQ